MAWYWGWKPCHLITQTLFFLDCLDSCKVTASSTTLRGRREVQDKCFKQHPLNTLQRLLEVSVSVLFQLGWAMMYIVGLQAADCTISVNIMLTSSAVGMLQPTLRERNNTHAKPLLWRSHCMFAQTHSFHSLLFIHRFWEHSLFNQLGVHLSSTALQGRIVLNQFTLGGLKHSAVTQPSWLFPQQVWNIRMLWPVSLSQLM